MSGIPAQIDRDVLIGAMETGIGMVMITDHDGRILYVNQTFQDVCGYGADELVGQFPSMLGSGLQTKEFYKALWSTIESNQSFSDVFINRKKDGSLYYEEKTITPLNIQGAHEDRRYLAVGRDITHQIDREQRLARFVNFDPVTELPNRAYFLGRLERTVARAKRARRPLAMVYCSLHRLSLINEAFGYETGDRALRELGQRLVEFLGEANSLARFPGNHFAFFIDHEVTVARVEPLLKALIEIIDEPFRIDDQEIHIGASIGASFFPTDDEPEQLIKHAELAMRKAKARGPNLYQLYTDEMESRGQKKLSMENELRRALEQEEFVLHYQPQIGLADERLVGVEALLRWQHPERGIIPPGKFIGLLEETGLILPVGEWIIQQACRDMREFQDNGLSCPRMAVNLSALQFANRELPLQVEVALRNNNIAAEKLELEITESIIMTGVKQVLRALHTLADIGLRLAIDDFGTGYSSMLYLKQFPVHILKIGGPFMQGVPKDERDVGIVRAVIAMAHHMGLEVVAEMIEDQHQHAFLQTEGCNIGQGFFYSRPIEKVLLMSRLRPEDEVQDSPRFAT